MGIQLLYAAAVFTSAFLLFQVQPLISKAILPWFGGTPAVWTTCMLFFQAVLLGGYAYAHLLREKLKPRRQVIIHVIAVLLALALLPILPGEEWKPTTPQDPVWRILLILSVSVGIPYFLLSTTGPLLQAWYSMTSTGEQPYRLYAVSNAGSLLALLSYPFLIQPRFAITKQAWLWSAIFALLAVLIACIGLSVWWRTGGPVSVSEADDPPGEGEPAPSWLDRFMWLALATCPSVLLLAFTNYMCRDIASVPFLWILPLTIYLLTFIICFDNEEWYWRPAFLPVFVVGVGAIYYLLKNPSSVSIVWHIVIASTVLFACAMACHGELVRRKPAPRYLTSFYLYVAGGGALGGVFVAMVAPMLFSGYFELHTGLIAAVLLVCVALLEDRDIGRKLEFNWWVGAAMLGIALVSITGVAFGRIALSTDYGVFYRHRNFYGVLKLKRVGLGINPEGLRFTLLHDGIIHGSQYQSLPRRVKPVSYYGKESGAGILMRNFREDRPKHVGVLGLGVGTMAAFGKEVDRYRFYEINPEVARLARTHFTYLADSPASCKVVLGDARFSLEQEENQQFDVLAMDVFRGDAVPVHMLTREAFQLYLRHLKQDGILLVNISNRHLDLWPLMNALAEEFDLETATITATTGDSDALTTSRWVLLSRSGKFINSSVVQEAADDMDESRTVRLWTDNYSSLFSLLR